MSPELEKIKKKYGEKFAHLCRRNFPTILDNEGMLLEILESKFAETKNLYDDLIEQDLEIHFKDYIYDEYDNYYKKEEYIEENRTPYEILNEAGYDLIECHTEDEIQNFRKWYAPNELICTIYNGGRLNSSVVFFAVKKNAEEIKRQKFDNPKREDEYGTSVLGIQFDKYGRCSPHIISRYNHTVDNPNGTYGNDLNKIASGLEESFSKLLKERGLELNSSNVSKFKIHGYTVANDGRYYKYNNEINGVYYCENNVILDHGTIKKLDKSEYMLVDYFIVDLVNKKITTYDSGIKDAFLDDIEHIKKINVQKSTVKSEKNTKIISITCEDKKDISIKIDRANNIIGYENENITDVGNYFLRYNETLRELSLPQLENVGGGFLLYHNNTLKKINLPELKNVGDDFFYYNNKLTEINLPELETVGDGFLSHNETLAGISLPELKNVGKCFLHDNATLIEINLPKLKNVGDDFFYYNKTLRKINLPQLKKVGDYFLRCNNTLIEINLPELETVGDGFLHDNETLTEISLPQLEKVGDYFLEDNETLTEISLPQLKHIGEDFLYYNTTLAKINLPKLENVGSGFLERNSNIKKNKANIFNYKQISELARTRRTSGIRWIYEKIKKIINRGREDGRNTRDR